ncbi:hypothetical protein EV363DRAFT_1259602 [Boletus edulis]|nr:hypothetical protein EV363DRAFT_1259602 [Boletus edulis]
MPDTQSRPPHNSDGLTNSDDGIISQCHYACPATTTGRRIPNREDEMPSSYSPSATMRPRPPTLPSLWRDALTLTLLPHDDAVTRSRHRCPRPLPTLPPLLM